jgi:hypothetical protein
VNAGYSKNHTEHTNTLCEQNANALVLKVAVFRETNMGRPKAQGVGCRTQTAEARV